MPNGGRGNGPGIWAVGVHACLASFRVGQRRLEQALAAGRSTTAARASAVRATQQTIRLPATSAAFTRRAAPAGLWAAVLASRLFDLAGGPELAELVLHIVTHSTPLTAGERAAGAEILGAHALRWDEVRVAQGGLLNLIFRRNGGRAFAAWHTICLPGTGLHVRENLGLIVHELVHVYQYELLGAAYMIEALLAQRSVEGYNYGAARDLRQGHAEGKRYSSYNHEQQAQIAQDYYMLSHQTAEHEPEQQQIAESCACYEPHIRELPRRSDLTDKPFKSRTIL